MRVRDIVVRDRDGTVVASAPKAEIRVSGLSLLSGHMRAESLSLVGAELAVRIEQDGAITVFASGADQHPIARTSAPLTSAPLVVARNAGHDIPTEAPHLVAFAIDEVVRAVRRHTRRVNLDPAQIRAADGNPSQP